MHALNTLGHRSSNLYHLLAGRILYRIFSLLDAASPPAAR